MEKGYADRVERLAQPSDPNRPAPPQGGDGSTGAAGNVGGYNNFWIDPGDRVAVVNGEYRSSLIVDPPNGRPPRCPERGKARAAARAERLRTRGGEYDHPEFRPLAERCLMSFGSNAGPPMLPNYFYNNNYQIVQTKDHILILVEMVHDVRVIRLNATSDCRRTSGRGWAIRSGAGKATRWSSRRPTSIRCRRSAARPRT